MSENQPKDDSEGPEAPEAIEEILEDAAEAEAQGDDTVDIDMQAAADGRIAELEKEMAEIKDKAARVLAEADNIRKRAEREKADSVKFAVTKFAKDMLEVADNMRRAIDAVPAESREDNDMVKNILVGVEATERTLLAVFEKHGIEKIEPTEGKFDPNMHEVMFEAPMEGKQSGEIIQLLEPGYQLNGRLLRPARVGVAKAG